MYLLLVSLIFPGNLLEEVGPNNDVPELKVLSKYLGTWDSELPKGAELKSESTSKWIMNGNYLETETVTKIGNGHFVKKTKTIKAYDKENKVYRSWSFGDNGQINTDECKWDPKQQTMTTTQRVDKFTIITTADLSKDGIIQWHSIVKDETDRVTRESTSMARKRK